VHWRRSVEQAYSVLIEDEVERDKKKKKTLDRMRAGQLELTKA